MPDKAHCSTRPARRAKPSPAPRFLIAERLQANIFTSCDLIFDEPKPLPASGVQSRRQAGWETAHRGQSTNLPKRDLVTRLASRKRQ
jgi:hypothetical protein